MIRLEMLPANHGDALLLEWGPGTTTRRRMLIDAGPRNAYAGVRERLLRLPARNGRRRVDLLVVTHVDGDHIEGVIALLQDDELALDVREVWFNDWNHLEPLVAGQTPAHLGPEQGEFLGALLEERGVPWNHAFDGGAVVCTQPGDGRLPVRRVGGMALTVVSPTVDTLIVLRKNWKKAIEAAGFRPGSRADALAQFHVRRWAKKPPALGTEAEPKTLDHAPANGSSIGLLAEYGGRRLLLTGDAFAQVLRPALERWRDERPASRTRDGTRVPFDVVKLAHHGSANNVSPELLGVLDTPVYLVSTSGAVFHHPDVAAIRMVVEEHPGPGDADVRFNYHQPQTDLWAGRPGITARYGDDALVELETH
jgi:beta-lactamase superfamily II metal-dependent hydrolase